MNISSYTGSPYGFEFSQVPNDLSEEQVHAYCNETRKRFASIAKTFDNQANTEWTVRHYIAVKYILASTVLFATAQYGSKRNVRVTLPYSNYYGALYCARAFLLTTPDLVWQGSTTLEMSHSKIINVTVNALLRIRPDAKIIWGRTLETARTQRELFSYRSPATGPKLLGEGQISLDQAIAIARLLAELAQINSDCLESALRKHAGYKTFEVLANDDAALAWQYHSDTQLMFDDDDAIRIARLMRHQQTVSNLASIATAGLVEDFFGVWCADDSDEDAFNPDTNWRLIFPFN